MKSKKPFILLITTDEQHLSTISAFGAASHSTPAIDSIVGRAAVCTNAYSISPVCLPARCAWMTGLAPHRSGSLSNHFGASLSPQYPNLFTELRAQGYTSSMHGKCHFIPVPYPATRPDLTLEYEHFMRYYRSLGMDRLDLQDDKNNSLWYYDDYAKDLERAGLLREYRRIAHQTEQGKRHFPFPGPASMHPDSWVGAKALERLETLPGDLPHFMWVSFSGPHYPVDAPDEYLQRVDMKKALPRIRRDGEWDDRTKLHSRSYYGPGGTEGSGGVSGGAQREYTAEFWDNWRRAYFANVVQIDDWIGRIVRAAEAKWGDDLMIVFTSDHGDMMGNHDLWGKNHSLAQDVLRIPFAVRYPGQRERVNIVAAVSSLELFPTVLKAAGAPLPSCDGLPLDEMAERNGRDHIVSLCDNRVAVIADGMKLEWNRYERTGELFKELYDLSADPEEFVNLYGNPVFSSEQRKLEAILQRLEEEQCLLSSVFYDVEKRPYWLNDGAGAGLRPRSETPDSTPSI